MKIAPLMIIAALGVPLTLGCGGGDTSDAPAAGTEQVSPAPERAGDVATPAEAGMSADLQAFIKDYEEFIDKYCELADRFSRATMAELAQLGQEMGEQAMKFGEYSAQTLAMRASFSPEAQAKMEELQKRGEACGERIAGRG
jgi:hypothetical protein